MRTKHDKNEVRALYASGLSTREVGLCLNIDPAQVYRLCEDIIRTHFRPESTHWRTNRVRARVVMGQHIGRKLESSEIVHHINEDCTDNRIENLQIMTRAEHMHIHHDQGKGSISNPLAYQRQWREHNRERINANMREWRRNRIKVETKDHNTI